MVYSESVFIAEDTKKKGLLTYWNKVKVSFNYRMNGLQFIISTESDCSDGLLRDHSFCKLTRKKQTNKHRQKKQDKQNKNKTKTNEQIKQK